MLIMVDVKGAFPHTLNVSIVIAAVAVAVVCGGILVAVNFVLVVVAVVIALGD